LLADSARKQTDARKLGRRQGDAFAGVSWRRAQTSAGFARPSPTCAAPHGVPGGTARRCLDPL